MPASRYAHCMVTLHDGKIMILGGYLGGPRKLRDPKLKSVMIFNPEDNTFTSGPSLLFGRVRFGCALFQSPLHENRPVILAAGGDGTYSRNPRNTAEVLDYTNTIEWQQSKLINTFSIIGEFSN